MNYHHNEVNGLVWQSDGIIYLITLAGNSVFEALYGYETPPLPMGPCYNILIPAANAGLHDKSADAVNNRGTSRQSLE